NSGHDAENYLFSTFGDNFVFPLTQPWLRASYALDLKNYGTTFGWYHFVNIFLHLSAVVALFALVFRVAWRSYYCELSKFDPYKLAFVTATLFACHPMASQSVTYISARYALLASANFLLALNCFIAAFLARGRTGQLWAWAGTVFFGFMA